MGGMDESRPVKKRKSKRLPNFLADDEPVKLLKATSRERDRLMLMLMRYLGLRVSEVVKLHAEHIDFDRQILMVRDGKGGRDRGLPLPDFLGKGLRGWLAGKQAGHVFPSPRGGGLTTRAVQLLIKRLAVKAGLRDPLASRRVTPHKLRHAFCSERIARGVDLAAVRDLMGHSSLAVTDRYAHATPERLREAIEK